MFVRLSRLVNYWMQGEWWKWRNGSGESCAACLKKKNRLWQKWKRTAKRNARNMKKKRRKKWKLMKSMYAQCSCRAQSLCTLQTINSHAMVMRCDARCTQKTKKYNESNDDAGIAHGEGSPDGGRCYTSRSARHMFRMAIDDHRPSASSTPVEHAVSAMRFPTAKCVAAEPRRWISLRRDGNWLISHSVHCTTNQNEMLQSQPGQHRRVHRPPTWTAANFNKTHHIHVEKRVRNREDAFKWNDRNDTITAALSTMLMAGTWTGRRQGTKMSRCVNEE